MILKSLTSVLETSGTDAAPTVAHQLNEDWAQRQDWIFLFSIIVVFNQLKMKRTKQEPMAKEVMDQLWQREDVTY
nr:hypothetical protein Iba_chr14eCG11300 [Ipomoea batatas]